MFEVEFRTHYRPVSVTRVVKQGQRSFPETNGNSGFGAKLFLPISRFEWATTTTTVTATTAATTATTATVTATTAAAATSCSSF